MCLIGYVSDWITQQELAEAIRYSQGRVSGTTGGEDIRAVSEKQAFQWCQKRNQTEAA